MHQAINAEQMFQQDKVIMLLSLDQLLKPNIFSLETHASIFTENIFNKQQTDILQIASFPNSLP